MRPVYQTYALAAADADAISLSQAPLGAGNLTITGVYASGGVATMDAPRVVGIASDGNDSGKTFTVYGTDANGNAISEAVTGPNAATASTVNNFSTVTRVAINAASVGNITVGTTAVGADAWVPLDYVQAPFNIGLYVIVTGTVNYTVQYTPHDVFDPTAQPVAFNHSYMAAQTASMSGNFAFPCRAARIKINSGTGSVQFVVLQGLSA